MVMKFKDMEDGEIVEAILEAIDEDGRINQDYIDIICHDGKVAINGRVSSEEELHFIDEILGEVLEVDGFKNNVWVDDTLEFDSSEEDEKDEVKGLKFEDDGDIDDRDYSEDEDEDEYK